jgi:predicted naringenin-chalcone synthase
MKISEATQSQCTSLILMVVDHWKIRKRIMAHPSNKPTQRPSTRDTKHTAIEEAQRTEAEVMAEALIQSNPCTICTMTVKLTTAPKTALSSYSQIKKWSKIL